MEDYKTTERPRKRPVLIFFKGKGLIKASTEQHLSNDESEGSPACHYFLIHTFVDCKITLLVKFCK